MVTATLTQCLSDLPETSTAAHRKSLPHCEQQCASSMAMRARRPALYSFSNLPMKRLAFTTFSGVTAEEQIPFHSQFVVFPPSVPDVLITSALKSEFSIP